MNEIFLSVDTFQNYNKVSMSSSMWKNGTNWLTLECSSIYNISNADGEFFSPKSTRPNSVIFSRQSQKELFKCSSHCTISPIFCQFVKDQFGKRFSKWYLWMLTCPKQPALYFFKMGFMSIDHNSRPHYF